MHDRLKIGETIGDRIIKINHAGEHGAISIYRAQIALARWRAPSLVPDLQEFVEHERRHRSLFAEELSRRGMRRCRSFHLCGFGGFSLGVVTGLFGRNAMIATTVAIERVVLEHLEQQIITLDGKDRAAVATISEIIEDERSHHDRSLNSLNQDSLLTRTIDLVVSNSTELVIWLGMKL